MNDQSESKTLAMTEKFLLPIDDLEEFLVEYFKRQGKPVIGVILTDSPVVRSTGWNYGIASKDAFYDFLEMELQIVYSE